MEILNSECRVCVDYMWHSYSLEHRNETLCKIPFVALYYTCHLRLLDVLSLNVNSVEKCAIAAWLQTNNRSSRECVRIFAWIICSFARVCLGVWCVCMSAFTYLHALALVFHGSHLFIGKFVASNTHLCLLACLWQIQPSINIQTHERAASSEACFQFGIFVPQNLSDLFTRNMPNSIAIQVCWAFS